jgi:glucosamine 6-phosphate synthetase-like amidotransferase/phosphosugar isomerase protein
MCGIFGYSNIKENGAEHLRVMADQQVHRGLDSEGLHIERKFGLGILRQRAELFKAVRGIEFALSPLSKYLGMFMTIEIEKTGERTIRDEEQS